MKGLFMEIRNQSNSPVNKAPLKILMAIDKRIIPKILLKTSKPVLPNFLSNQLVLFKTAYTIPRLMIIPTAIFAWVYSAFKVKIVVRVPAPAIRGNAMGTIEALVVEASGSGLKSSIPKIISAPMAKMIKAPAMAKSSTPIPNNFKIDSPKNKNRIIRNPAAMVALPDWIWPTFFLRLMTMGIDPKISITEKRIKVTEKISLRLNIGSIFL